MTGIPIPVFAERTKKETYYQLIWNFSEDSKPLQQTAKICINISTVYA